MRIFHQSLILSEEKRKNKKVLEIDNINSLKINIQHNKMALMGHNANLKKK